MAIVHNVEIVWDELVDAFTSGQSDRVYFLDRYTGEIFFIPAANDDEELWRQMETGRDRFLEIPRIDYGIERQFLYGFNNMVQDAEARKLLTGLLAGKGPFGKVNDIISFFPEEEERLAAMKDEFLASRVNIWLEENNLFTAETEAMLSSRL
jgi:hypothetical protein